MEDGGDIDGSAAIEDTHLRPLRSRFAFIGFVLFEARGDGSRLPAGFVQASIDVDGSANRPGPQRTRRIDRATGGRIVGFIKSQNRLACPGQEQEQGENGGEETFHTRG